VASWIDYWNGEHAIYVSERHKLLHARAIAADILRHVPGREAVVLDYGCGEALYAEDVARKVGTLLLCDAAPAVRAKLAERVAALPQVRVLSPEEAAALEDGSVDVIIVNSVLQYLDEVTLAALLAVWRARLREGGRLVIADVIPPDVSPVADALALLRFAWRGGFLRDAVAGLIRTALSDYRALRGELGLSKHGEEDMISLLSRHGFHATRVQPNFGHNQQRMTFVATPD
jgi:SAM-dependent methyltransferase